MTALNGAWTVRLSAGDGTGIARGRREPEKRGLGMPRYEEDAAEEGVEISGVWRGGVKNPARESERGGRWLERIGEGVMTCRGGVVVPGVRAGKERKDSSGDTGGSGSGGESGVGDIGPAGFGKDRGGAGMDRVGGRGRKEVLRLCIGIIGEVGDESEGRLCRLFFPFASR